MKLQPKDLPVRLGLSLDSNSHVKLQEIRKQLSEKHNRNISLSEAMRFAILNCSVG